MVLKAVSAADQADIVIFFDIRDNRSKEPDIIQTPWKHFHYPEGNHRFAAAGFHRGDVEFIWHVSEPPFMPQQNAIIE